MKQVFRTKDDARQAVWDELTARKAARFPFPVQGRIPNFAGAKEAAGRLFSLPPLNDAARVKVNPDAPQKPVREEALRRGIAVYMPTPRLRSGFLELDPRRIPQDKLREAASLSKCGPWANEVPLDEFPAIDAIVTGSVAVTREGLRCGKGHGYGDLEYAILRELGYPPVPVVTTVHPLQIVKRFPCDSNDLPLSVIATPGEVIHVKDPPPAPEGIDWERITEAMIEEMPVLGELSAGLE